MSKQKFQPNQTVYTKNYGLLPDGTKLTVSDTYKGGIMISCLNELKKFFFINESQLSDTKPTIPVIDKDSLEALEKEIEELNKVISIPSWLRPIGNSHIAAGRMIYVYDHDELPDHAILYVAETYVYNMLDKEVRCVVKSTSPWVYHTVPKENIYVPTHSNNYPVKPTVKKPLASEFNDFTEDHKYMIELLKEPKRSKVIELTLRGVDLSLYDSVVGLKYFVLVPKKPETAYMPMIMAHTDIQRNVSHPNENLEYNPTLDMFSSPKGLGADDRAGCYAINKILLKHPGKFIIALFDEEEIGCNGSTDFTKAKEFAEVDKMASCYISIDRKRGYNGVGQIATYGSDNKRLFELVKTATGRLTVPGSSTDCKALAAGSSRLPNTAGLACFNMSCGYINEHTANESLYFKELQQVVTDFDCMALSAEELWAERFPAEKVKTQSSTYGTLWSQEDTIYVDGEEYDEGDFRNLLHMYEQTTGRVYEFNQATLACKEFEKNTYVRLDTQCVAGGVYGGSKLSKDLYNVLNEYTWIVTSFKGMRYELKSECNTQTASNVPVAWLKSVLVTDPITQSIGEKHGSI